MANAVETTYGSYNKTLKNEVVREPKTTWDQDMFLKVLVAQMSNQDPMNPQSDTEFIGQMAQFSSLEQMTKMSGSLAQMQAYNLTGKYVLCSYTPPNSTETIPVYGKVDSTFTQSGISYVVINNPVLDSAGKQVYDAETGEAKFTEYHIPISDVTEVFDPGQFDISKDINMAILEKLQELINLLKPKDADAVDPTDPSVRKADILTNKPLDASITGNGLFAVSGSDGTLMYTRAGRFNVNGSGNLTDVNGNAVMGYKVTGYTDGDPMKPVTPAFDGATGAAPDKIALDTDNYEDFFIDANGYVCGKDKTTGDSVALYHLCVATFDDAKALNKQGEIYYTQTAGSGNAMKHVAGSSSTGAASLNPGALEEPYYDMFTA